MISFSPVPAAAQHAQSLDCAAQHVASDWSRTEYRACRRLEVQQNIDRLDAEFAGMKAWLQARGLDVNEAGHITDPEGRTLAQIEVSNAALAAGNAALRADIANLRLSIQTSRAEYQEILKDFERAILSNN